MASKLETNQNRRGNSMSRFLPCVCETVLELRRATLATTKNSELRINVANVAQAENVAM